MTLDDPEFRKHVDEGRYATALKILRTAQVREPDNSSITRSVLHLQARLMRQCIGALGSLDSVPYRASEPSRDHESTLCLVDGIASYDDILEASSRSRLDTLVLLVEMDRVGTTTLDPLGRAETDEKPEGFEVLLDEAMMALLGRDYPRALSLLVQARATGQSHPLLESNFTRLADLGFTPESAPPTKKDDKQ